MALKVWPTRNAGNWHFLNQRTILALLSIAWKRFLLHDSSIRIEALVRRITLRLSTKVKAVRTVEQSTAITWSAILLSR